MPNATTILEACIFATVMCVLFGIILKKNSIANIISILNSMDAMVTGAIVTSAIAQCVLVASHGGMLAPIASDNPQVVDADPVPQTAILTAIVMGFSIQALMPVGAIELTQDRPTLERHAIEKTNMP